MLILALWSLLTLGVQDAFHRYLVEGETEAVNSDNTGTKAGLHYKLDLQPGDQSWGRGLFQPHGPACLDCFTLVTKNGCFLTNGCLAGEEKIIRLRLVSTEDEQSNQDVTHEVTHYGEVFEEVLAQRRAEVSWLSTDSHGHLRSNALLPVRFTF